MHLARVKRLQAAIAAAKLDCAAVIAGPNLYYLTGLSYHLSERPTVGFFPAQGDPVIVAGILEQTKTMSAPYPVRGFFYTDADGPANAFSQAARALNLSNAQLGVEARRMRLMEIQLIEEAFSQIKLDGAEEVFAGLRMTKDALEEKLMRQATVIAETALKNTLPLIKIGMTEREIGAELVVQTLRAGSDAELPFAPIVASGPNSAFPHASITDRKIQAGDLLTLDWGAGTQGYFADLTRTFAVGDINDELRRIYDLVKNANLAGQAAAKPGVTCASVDAAARKVISDGGYGEYFVHRLGHGLGLEGHEDPSMHGNNQLKLEKGMTFTIEPGIYVTDKGGVRIEDDVIVTENGCESFSVYPRDLQVVG